MTFDSCESPNMSRVVPNAWGLSPRQRETNELKDRFRAVTSPYCPTLIPVHNRVHWRGLVNLGRLDWSARHDNPFTGTHDLLQSRRSLQADPLAKPADAKLGNTGLHPDSNRARAPFAQRESSWQIPIVPVINLPGFRSPERPLVTCRRPILIWKMKMADSGTKGGESGC
jgi:hypothetical protein